MCNSFPDWSFSRIHCLFSPVPWKTTDRGSTVTEFFHCMYYVRVTNWIKINLCCVRLNKHGLFSNKHNGMAAIKIPSISCLKSECKLMTKAHTGNFMESGMTIFSADGVVITWRITSVQLLYLRHHPVSVTFDIITLLALHHQLPCFTDTLWIVLHIEDKMILSSSGHTWRFWTIWFRAIASNPVRYWT